MLEASPTCLPEPLFAFIREACAKIVQSPLSAAMIVFPQHSSEKTGEVEISFDIEKVNENYKSPQSEIVQKILDGIVFFLFLLSWHRISHRA